MPTRPSYAQPRRPVQNPTPVFSNGDKVGCPTFRDRLLGPQKHPAEITPDTTTTQDVRRHFYDCMAASSARDEATDPAAAGPEIESPLQSLRDSFARAGLGIRAEAGRRIIRANKAIEAQIVELSGEMSATLSETDALYHNIAHPLSSTVCHIDDYPRASILKHLHNLAKDIQEAESQLQSMEEEWHRCLEAEENAQVALQASLSDNRRALSPCAEKAFAALQCEAEGIASQKERLVDEVEAEYKALLQEETMKIMQSILGD